MSATVTALEPVTALAVRTPDSSRYLLGHAPRLVPAHAGADRPLRDADRKRIEFGAYDTTGRVAARLVELAERFGEQTDGGAADQPAAVAGRARRLDRIVPGGGHQGVAHAT